MNQFPIILDPVTFEPMQNGKSIKEEMDRESFHWIMKIMKILCKDNEKREPNKHSEVEIVLFF